MWTWPPFMHHYGLKGFIWTRLDFIPWPLRNHMPPLPIRQPLYLGESAQGFLLKQSFFSLHIHEYRRETIDMNLKVECRHEFQGSELINILMQEPWILQEGRIFNLSEFDKFYMVFRALIAMKRMVLLVSSSEVYIFQSFPECMWNHDFSKNR